MKFNINGMVKVRLTQHGRSFIVYKHALSNEKRGCEGDYPEIVEDKDGWSYWQLWKLMNEFGGELSASGPMMFAAEIELVTPAEPAVVLAPVGAPTHQSDPPT